MTRCAAAIALGITGALNACGDAARPSRDAPYEFAIECPTAPGCRQDSDTIRLVFRWPAAALPMRIWVDPGSGLHGAVVRGIRVWENVALYGEFRGVIVSDSASADVLFHRGPAFAATNTTGGLGQPEVIDCHGSTSVDVRLDTTIVLPRRTTLSPRAGQSQLDVDACFAAVAAHELGHSLGLLLHSDDPADLMYVRPQVAGPSGRDRATFTHLYHSTPTVRLPTGR